MPTGEIPYLEMLGLDRPPFAPEPDPDFFYRDAELGQRLDMLAHLARYGDLLLMIIGPAGAGKTSLRQQFVAENRNELQIGQVEVDEALDADSLAGRIGQAFGLGPGSTPAELTRQLRQAGHGGTPLLVVDDAHRLGAEALRLILDLADSEEDSGPVVRVILFCEPAIEETLADGELAPLRERITHTLQIPGLTAAQTAAYLHHRLRVAGFDGQQDPFPAKVARRIQRTARGNPARINELAHKSLLAKAGRGSGPRLALAPDRRVIYALGGAAGLGLVALLPIWGGDGSEEKELEPLALELPEEAGQAEPASEEEPSSGGSPTSPEGMADERPRLKGWPADAEGGPTLERVEPDEVPAGEGEQRLVLHGDGFPEGSRVRLGYTGGARDIPADAVERLDGQRLAVTFDPGGAADTWTARVSTPEGQGTGTASFRVVAPDPEPEPAPESEPEPEEPTAEPPEQEESGVADSAAAGATEPEPTADETPESAREDTAPAAPEPEEPEPETTESLQPAEPAAAEETGGPHGSDWVRQRPGDHRTLQLLASHREEVVQRAAEGRDWPDPVATVLTADGWYLLLHGDYADAEAAQSAAAALAERTDLEPWQRPFSAIQGRLPGNAPVPEESTESTAEAEGAAWLREQAGQVTLQLFATRERERAQAFREESDLETRLVAVEREGTPWYLVVTGAWPDRETARAAVDDLPAEVRDLGPWPRPVDELAESRAGSE
ncbi:Type II secretory pathway, component ExeA (predicted ATPase) [Thiohalospira halophila DSM 15071]|uniref:Type II secretory pathway, component ExeA (Predicted ATPase) n=1 Tax=Thiohalospira halophila DSM 15071 TaxID=1123397 RepID=A0A1I1TBD8_9GAMM|nr:AAA family ATPase [Thiohalospira halophila]SFD55967.1 Type II secretory pathway, component ExeA (predicted ATPase) [Thiohalospira halophila DSM 15071]